MKSLLSILLMFTCIAAIGQETAETDTAKSGKATKGLPLEPARTLSLKTSEGTCISLDISPDGKTIAFDMMGDLYTMPIGGGKAEQITSGMAFDTHPRFSQDGKSIAFTSDRSGSENIWILDLDKSDS